MPLISSTTARCPGAALVHLETGTVYTDPGCESCLRCQQARIDVAQWVADGRPRVQGGRPDMPHPWIAATARPGEACASRLEEGSA